MSFAPCGMGVGSIDYVAEKTWGIGLPSDNETGVIVYNLPEDAVKAIASRGIDYLRQLPCKKDNRDSRGRYHAWKETPIPAEGNWAESAGGEKSALPEVSNYLDKYGFGIRISKSVETTIGNAISAPGSFFAYGRSGAMLVVPSKRQAFYVYAG
ncbi:hypothetical protein [Mesorhizobium sp. ANAO-SY3R2]|uniref:hypothetical protein n=1 Tax=Mesorhizobium sp. ANAO-SY3R2 TaxID=3166644 RepID=UPI0036723A72